MKFPTIYRQTSAVPLVAILLVSAHGMSRRFGQSDDQKQLGTLSPEFYQKGLVYINQNYESKQWKELMNVGLVPYHRLTSADFKVDDQVASDSGVFTAGFIRFLYRGRFAAVTKSSVRAVVSEMLVMSGLDSTRTWRRSWMKDPNQYLEHEQGHQDINEMAAKTFAGLVVSTRPEGVGATQEEAVKDLDAKLQALCAKVDVENRKEQREYDTDTKSGWDKEGQKKATASIAARMKQANVRPTWVSATGQTIHSATDKNEVIF